MSRKTGLTFERRVMLENDVGLHARPAARFVREAAKYRCDIEVMKDGNVADAKSITSILFLDARKGDVIAIKTSGADAEEALEALTKLVKEFASRNQNSSQ